MGGADGAGRKDKIYNLSIHIIATMCITYFYSHSHDTVIDCNPRFIGCYSDGVVTICLKSCYIETSRIIYYGCINYCNIMALSCGISLPRNLIYVHPWTNGSRRNLDAGEIVESTVTTGPATGSTAAGMK